MATEPVPTAVPVELTPEEVEEQALLAHPMLKDVLPLHETSDMVLVIRLRRIIEGNEKALARVLLKHYRFWYHDQMHETSQVFWTENHIIMSQSSHLLLLEFLSLPIPPQLHSRISTYLDLKLTLGMAEFLSPVYYPFTIASLLNLHDFTQDTDIKKKCHALLDQMSNQILSVCLPDGSIVSPSGRSYARHRAATQGHHISLFIQYLTTRTNIQSPPDAPESALREALKTTTYLPEEGGWVYTNFNAKVTDLELPLSPTWNELYMFLQERKDTMTLEDRVSTLWSHGAYFHPQAVLEILPFMDQVDLWTHPHFKAAAPARRGLGMLCPCVCMLGNCLTCCSHSCAVKPFVMGALLTGARLAVHKEGNVLLSSLTGGFNAGLPAFQQWPWAINMNGIPIWCTFGPVEAGAIGRRLGNASAGAEMSTARVTPLMRQRGNVLHAIYLSATCGLAVWNRNLRPRVRWPEDEMDESGSLKIYPRRTKLKNAWLPQCVCACVPTKRRPNVWRWGRKGSVCVCWTVVGLEVTVLVRDLEVCGCTVQELLAGIEEEFGAPKKKKGEKKGEEGKGEGETHRHTHTHMQSDGGVVGVGGSVNETDLKRGGNGGGAVYVGVVQGGGESVL